jgi:hypothetical protein
VRIQSILALGRRWVNASLKLLLLGLTLSFGALVFGASADIARGVAWLQAQVQSQGVLAVESQAAAQQQARCETAATLLKLSGSNAQVAALIAALREPAVNNTVTETLACWQQLRQQLGQTVLDADLEARRLNGNAYSPFPDFGAVTALDTGWALATQLERLSPADKANSLAWLQANQRSDGSFEADAGQAFLSTAIVLRALKDEALRNPAAAQIAAKAAAYLLGRRSPQGHWLNDVASTALAYEATHPYIGSDGVISSAVEMYLLGKQQPDGSWAGDPYVTALALRALALTAIIPIEPAAAGSATVRGVATAADTGQPLAGVSVQATGAGAAAKTALTDAQGNYLLQGIAPGSVTLTAALAGYQTVAGVAQLGSATTANFSPALYLVGATPATTAHISGRVTAFGTDAALPGVSVSATAGGGSVVAVITAANGGFDLTVPAGNLVLAYSLAGYEGQTQQVVLVGGAEANLGTIPLRKARESSTLRGLVSDLQDQPISGATVAVQSGPAATSNAAGAYSLANLSGLHFVTRVSAPGYATRDFVIDVSAPTDVVQNFTLPSLTTSYLNLSDLVLSTQSTGLRKDVTASVTVSNPSASQAQALLTMEVIDPQGRRIATLSGLDQAGNPASAVSLAPAQQRQALFKWNTGSFAPGSYELNVRLQVPGSITQANPAGTVISSLGSRVAISAGASFIGSVSANPPVLRAGTSTPVKLAALIQNDGNTSLPAQGYKLAIVDTLSGQAVHSQVVSTEEILGSQLRSLSFADWVPTAGGNFRLELTAPSAPGALITGSLYVGDSGSANFTVDKPVVPAGTQTVRGSVKVSGQSVANGAINDPLVPLVKQALVKAVNYADDFASAHYVGDLRCFACHVQTQAIVGGERNLRFAPPLDPIKRSTLLTGITQYVRENGAILHESCCYSSTNTTLGLWATTEWHEPAAVAMSNRGMADYLMSIQGADGSWPADHGFSWWQTSTPLVALNLGSLASLRNSLGTLVPRSARLTSALPPGLPGGDMKLATDASGTLYVAYEGPGQVWAVSPAGVPTLLAQGIPANSARPLADGRLLIGANNGVFIRAVDGALTQISTIPAWDVKPYTNGQYLLSARNQDTAYVLNENGTAQPLITNSLFGGSLAGVEVEADGSFVAASWGGTRVIRFNAQGQLRDVPVPLTNGQVLNVARHGEGHVVNTEAGLFYFNKEWAAERWGFDRVYSFVAMPDGRLLVSRAGGLYEVHLDPVDTQQLAGRLSGSIDRATAWLQAGNGIDGNNNIDVAFRLIGLGKAKAYYANTSRQNEFDAAIQQIGATLRARQRSDGGWVWRQGYDGISDSMVTAMAGIALDNLNPSRDAPEVRNAIQLLLSRQQPDGSWITENSVSSQSVKLIPSTWVEIWLPTMLDRLGGIDSDLSVTLPANVVMSNPDRTPTRSITQADGSSNHVWNLVGVTEAGQQLNFDLTLQNMQVDEVRPVAQQASLVFRNSFLEGSVTAAIEVPKVAVTTNLTHTVSTDKPSYNETEQATFTALVSNAGTQSRDAQVRLSVLDAAGQVVQVLPLGSAVSVAGGANVPSSGIWPIGGTLSGNYQVKAELLSPAGVVYGVATASFVVSASQQLADTARINADRVSYTAAQPVQLTSRVANQTANVVQEALQARTVVSTAAGQPVFTQTEAIPQLAAGAQRQYSYSIAASGLAPGSYAASLQLLDAQGVVLAQSSASFTVVASDQSGIGLVGALQATPAVALIGQPVALNLTATNNGNAVLADIPVTVRLLEPTSGTVIASFTSVVSSWAQSANQNFAWTWPAVGLDGQTVVAAATAQVNGRYISLGQANIRLQGVPQLQAAPAQLIFSPIRVGQVSSQTVVLRAIGSAPVTSLTLTLGGVDASQFALTAGSCVQTTTLALGATCTAVISYRPTQAASHLGQLQAGYASGLPLAITLAGQAIPVAFTGSVAANPSQLPLGQSTNLVYSISNSAPIAGSGSFSLAVKNAQGQNLASWPFAATIAANASFAGNQSYTPTGSVQTLTVVLSQQTGSASAVLATASLRVTAASAAPPELTLSWIAQPRILVLLSCPVGQSNADDPACVARRSAGIAAYLDQLGLHYKIVTDAASFVHQMRCGPYNAYWISGGALKLDTQTVRELREAVWRGDGLIVDGIHDARTQLLHPLLGVQQKGKLPQAGYTAAIPADSVFTSVGSNLATLGQPTKFDLAGGGHSQANFPAQGNQASVPAIVTHHHGQGASVLLAFELADMLAQGGAQTVPQLDAHILELLRVTGNQVASTGVANLSEGDLLALRLHVSLPTGGTATQTIRVQGQLPAGTSHFDAQPTASTGTATVSWTINLAPGASQDIVWRVRIDQATTAGELVFNAQAKGTAATTTTASITTPLPQPGDTVDQALPAVQALQAVGKADQAAKATATAAVNSAVQLMGQGKPNEAIAKWIDAAEAITAITSTDTQAAHTALAQALEVASDAQCKALACIRGDLSYPNATSAAGVPSVVIGTTLNITRSVTNACPAQLKDIPATASMRNRRSGQEVLNLWDNLTLNPNQTHTRQAGWQVMGPGQGGTNQVGDWIDGLLWVDWQGHRIELDDAHVRICAAKVGAPANSTQCR